jgi:predicted DNA-binding transcriptional regulator AlpA
MSIIDTLPQELARHRVLDSRNTCEFVGISIAQWRKMGALGEIPAPIMLGSRKHGWRVGDLIDWLQSRERSQAAA